MDLVCFWCARELGISLAELAREFDTTSTGVSYAVGRGEKLAKEAGYSIVPIDA